MRSYAYKLVFWQGLDEKSREEAEAKLNKLGAEGWRVVSSGVRSGEYWSNCGNVWTLEREGQPRSPDEGRL